MIVMDSHGEANGIAVQRISEVSHEDFFEFAWPWAPFFFGYLNRRMIVIFTARSCSVVDAHRRMTTVMSIFWHAYPGGLSPLLGRFRSFSFFWR